MASELNKWGVDFIIYLQNFPIFSGNWESFWLCCTKLGDPSWIFTVYIPILYPIVGPKIVQFMVAGAVSEFLNGVFKWMMLSDRPYWWIHESHLYSSLPPLKQFALTCETGPGNPSGHAMISSSAWFVFVSNLNTKKTLAWIFYFVFLSLVSLSRLYVGTHFPHQVVFGLTIGILVGVVVQRITLTTFRFRFCFLLSLGLLFWAALTFLSLRWLSLDPNWSIALALKWCNKPEWVHMSTTPLASLFRDVGALLGLGLASELMDLSKNVFTELDLFKTVQASVLGLIFVQLTFICFPNVDSMELFYGLTCFQHFTIAMAVLYFIPNIFKRSNGRKVS